MTDTENATKAPESDAQETIIPGDTPAQTGPTMGVGEHCVTDRPTPSGQGSTGEVIKLGGVDTYISKPGDYPHAPCKLLLLLTGGTGIHSTNNQIQADRFASSGFLVLMPDMFPNDPAPGSAGTHLIPESTSSSSLLEQVKLKAVEVTKSFFVDMWLARVTPDKVMPILHKVIEAAQDEYADVVKNGEGIYAAGYCVGGRFVLLLGREAEPTKEEGADDEESARVKKGPYIRAGAVAHAASVSPDDFNGIAVPMSFVCVEDDPLFPDEVRTGGEDAMSKANLEHEVQVYPGVPHGFAVVGEYEQQSIRDAQVTAYEQMLKWLKEH